MKEWNGFSVRDARDEEREAIRDVTLAAYKEYATIMPGPAWQGYRQNLVMTLEKKMDSVEHIVAEHEGTIVGSVLLYPPMANVYTWIRVDADWPEVRLLAVAPEARGQGVGSALMDECERRAYNAGATMLGLHTADMMQAAVRMYERRGFIRFPKLDFYPGEGIHVKAYRLSLNESP